MEDTKTILGGKRGVVCGVCGKKLYYADEKKHEPEVALQITDTSMNTEIYYEIPYMHERCWNVLKKEITKWLHPKENDS